MSKDAPLADLFHSALQQDTSGYVTGLDAPLWAQAEELRRTLGRPFPDTVARLRCADGQRSAWYWHSVLPAVLGRMVFHNLLADLKARHCAVGA